MQLGSGRAVVAFPTADTEQSPAGGPGKFEFYCSKGHKLAYYLFIFHAKFSAV